MNLVAFLRHIRQRLPLALVLIDILEQKTIVRRTGADFSEFVFAALIEVCLSVLDMHCVCVCVCVCVCLFVCRKHMA